MPLTRSVASCSSNMQSGKWLKAEDMSRPWEEGGKTVKGERVLDQILRKERPAAPLRPFDEGSKLKELKAYV